MKKFFGYISVILTVFLFIRCTDDISNDILYDSVNVEKDGLVTVFDTIVKDTIITDTIDWSRFPKGPKTFYASPAGSQMNSGKHPDSAWTLDYGVSLIGAGDTLWVAKGNYGSLNIVMNQSGTADAPVHVLGYRDYPHDLDAPDNKPMYNTDDYIYRNPTTNKFELKTVLPEKGPAIINNLVGIGAGMRVNGSYVKIENLQFEGYESNLIGFGQHQTFRNIVSLKTPLITSLFMQHSNWTKMMLGSGMGVSYTNSYIINSIVLNSSECGPMVIIGICNSEGIGSAFMLFFRSGGPCPSM